jgi:actin-related protein 5
MYSFVAKQKNRKVEDLWQVGRDISYDLFSKMQIKSPYDQNIMCYFDTTEMLLDYTFSYLGLGHENQIPHPIVITEPLCNLNYCRRFMSELLFEAYQVPGICYGIDSLFSYYANYKTMKTGLIISGGHHAFHIIPTLDQHILTDQSKRLGLGGASIVDYTSKLLNLKYPFLSEKIDDLHMKVGYYLR